MSRSTWFRLKATSAIHLQVNVVSVNATGGGCTRERNYHRRQKRGGSDSVIHGNSDQCAISIEAGCSGSRNLDPPCLKCSRNWCHATILRSSINIIFYPNQPPIISCHCSIKH